MTEIFQSGLHEFITDFIEDNAKRPEISEQISRLTAPACQTKTVIPIESLTKRPSPTLRPPGLSSTTSG